MKGVKSEVETPDRRVKAPDGGTDAILLCRGRIYYDRNCPFCRAMARRGQRLFPSPAVEWVPADYSDLSRLPVPVDSIIYEENGQYWIKTEAVRRFLKRAGRPLLSALLGAFPLRWRDWLYDRIATRRYCMKGKCELP